MGLRYISVFSGIEAATVAWEPLGWEAVAFCEVDEFPSAVLAHRWPDVPNLGDITKVDWSEYSGSVDVVVGGSPCQSFSVAGKREGLAGESGLMFEYIRCVREVRPRWFVWENVPGALSSEKGAAFQQLLSEMDGLGYGLAWRVLDAQFFGVAQRRRRVFLVGSLGSQRAADVLFESESLCWDYPTSREKRKELTRAAGQRAPEGGGDGCLTSWDVQSKRIFDPNGCGPTLNSGTGEGKNIVPSVLAKTYCIQGNIARGARMGQNGSGISDDGTAYTLDTIDIHAVLAFQQNTRDKVLCMASGQANAEIEYDMTPAQAARQYKDPQIVCVADDNANAAIDEGLCGSLKVGGGVSPTLHIEQRRGRRRRAVRPRLQGSRQPVRQRGEGDSPMEVESYVVRRLTPTECERLQGFPDDHTLIPYRGKPAEECPDTPRYKALGNSMAVPVMRWIGERIQAVEAGGGR